MQLCRAPALFKQRTPRPQIRLLGYDHRFRQPGYQVPGTLAVVSVSQSVLPVISKKAQSSSLSTKFNLGRAAVGAATGYLYDQQKQKGQQAY
jgi:hypothetical protein